MNQASADPAQQGIVITGASSGIGEALALEADINADLPYRDFLEGRDTQLAKAVEVLMQEVKGIRKK